jgi:branched-chain amino acid transport system permease protein
MLTILFDGVAYGMLLFILAVGLAVTMGLMNFINLAHGAFAMVGGYITVLLMQRLDVPFLVCLPIAFGGAALLGAVLERTLYRPLYHKPHLDQVLFSIGLVFMAVAAIDYFVGSTQQNVQLPAWLKGRTEIGGGDWILGMGHYRLFIIAVCAALTVALQYILSRTRFGSRLRASVDDQRVAAGMGINVNVVFLSTFAFGSGLAGLGGALGAEVLVPSHERAAAGIGWVPQERNIFKSLTVHENLTAVARPGKWTAERVYQMFPRLAERKNNLGTQLSGGEQQMLAVGRALVINPRLLLLDEPLEGLAPIIVAELLKAIHRITREEGLAAIIVEQHPQAILRISHRAIVLDRGTVVHAGEADHLLETPELLDRLLGVAR